MTPHNFTPDSQIPNRCSVCNYLDIQHGFCAVCSTNNTVVDYKGNKVCFPCYRAEINKSHNVIAESQTIDQTIRVNTDFFNAHTVSIAELKSAIDTDAEIPDNQKNYKLAETLKERFNHFKTVAFEYQQKVVDANNGQRAIQVYLNNLANSLRQEEREKLKIQDINYKPNAVKTSTTVKKISSPKKHSMADIKRAAEKYNAPLSVIQTFVISQNMTPEQAGEFFMNRMKEQLGK